MKSEQTQSLTNQIKTVIHAPCLQCCNSHLAAKWRQALEIHRSISRELVGQNTRVSHRSKRAIKTTARLGAAARAPLMRQEVPAVRTTSKCASVTQKPTGIDMLERETCQTPSKSNQSDPQSRIPEGIKSDAGRRMRRVVSSRD